MIRRRLLAILALGAVTFAVLEVVVSHAGAAPACTDTFKGASGSDWATAANWTAGVPGPSTVACWSTGTSVVISSGAQKAGSVQGGSLQLTGGSLALQSAVNDSTLTDLSLDGSATLTGPLSQTITVDGTFEWGGCTPACATPTLSATIVQTGGGAFSIDGNGGLSGPSWTGGSIMTSSPVSITNQFFQSSGSETLKTTSTINIGTVQLTGLAPDTTFTAAGVTSSSGNYGLWNAALVLTGGTTTIAVNSDLEAGSITVSGGLLKDDGGIQKADGTVGLSTVTVTGGTVDGSGNMGNLDNEGGTVQPGDPATTHDTLTVSGTYTQGSGGTFSEQIAQSNVGFLQISGAATIAGELSITDVGGFSLGAGGADEILVSHGTRTGTFSTVDGPSAGVYAVTYPPQVVLLTDDGGTSTTTTSTTSTTSTTTTATPTTATTTTTTTTTPTSGGSVTAPSPVLGVPVDVVAPAITGTPTPTNTLACATGTWTNDPTGYRYLWSRDGTPLPGATGARYTVQIGDEGATLTCTVTASNAAGAGMPATSAGIIVAEPGTLRCPQPSGRLAGLSVGPLSLGLARSRARHILTRYQVTANDFDNFCLYGGWGIRVGYPSSTVLRGLSRAQRGHVTGRIVLALTANPFYALEGVRPGATLAAAAKRLHVGGSFHIGLNYWYLGPGGAARAVLKVRGGIVQEVGIANSRLSQGSRTAQRRFLASFKKA